MNESQSKDVVPPTTGSAPTATTAPQWKPEEKADDQIGRYKLLQKLGEGGCGTVYLAEQSEPVRRRVAVKVIKLGMDTKEVIARFEAERQALAMMDHPNIAKVFDAGTTDAGRPYFVMELVQGVPITTFCDEKKLPTAARLELFIQVCHAVQHAHQKGIIHRDIKPSNILVALHDDQPVPKVIDFGIAKATAGRLTDQTLYTAVEQFIGTPAYMSPEQAQVSAIDIDTRSDIYSLGVLLYELLTGRTPFDTAELLKVGIDEMRRHIREVDPPRPSTRLSTMKGDALDATAQRREVASPKLLSLIRGDLDWIVMRCLEKDRVRRYETANGLATDLMRHLHHEPVSASPPSQAYRLRKLVCRNKLVFAAGGVVAASLVLGVVVSTWQAVRASRAERIARAEAKRADGEAAISKAVNEFLVNDLLKQADSLAQADAKSAPNPELKVREALDRAGEKVGGRFEQQPLTEGAVRDAIGSAYAGVGDYAKAAVHLERALQLRKKVLGANHPDVLNSSSALALALHSQGKLEAATMLYARTLELRKRVLGLEHPDTLASMNNLGTVYFSRGKIAEAEALFAKTLEMRRRVLGAEHPNTLKSMNNLANAYRSQGKHAEAAVLREQTLEIRRRVLGDEHPYTLTSLNNLALSLQQQGRLTEAAALHHQALEIRKRILGAEHPDTLVSTNNLALTYAAQSKFAEAAAFHAHALAVQKRVLGAEHPDTLTSMNNLATALGSVGKSAEALALHLETLELRKRVLGAEHPHTLLSMNNLASAYFSEGKFTEAAALHAQTLELKTRVLGPEHFDTVRSRVELGMVMLQQKKFAEAEPLLVSGYEGINKRKSALRATDRVHLKEALERLVQLYTDWGKPDKAAEWQKKLDEFNVAEAKKQPPK